MEVTELFMFSWIGREEKEMDIFDRNILTDEKKKNIFNPSERLC